EVTVYEVRVPAPLFAAQPTEAVRKLLEDAAHSIDEAKLASLTPYYEVTFAADWRASVTSLSTALAQAHRPGRRPGFKLRCGGLEAAAFPSPEQVAFAITACRGAGVPVNVTARLHHPLPHFPPPPPTPL